MIDIKYRSKDDAHYKFTAFAKSKDDAQVDDVFEYNDILYRIVEIPSIFHSQSRELYHISFNALQLVEFSPKLFDQFIEVLES